MISEQSILREIRSVPIEVTTAIGMAVQLGRIEQGSYLNKEVQDMFVRGLKSKFGEYFVKALVAVAEEVSEPLLFVIMGDDGRVRAESCGQLADRLLDKSVEMSNFSTLARVLGTLGSKNLVIKESFETLKASVKEECIRLARCGENDAARSLVKEVQAARLFRAELSELVEREIEIGALRATLVALEATNSKEEVVAS